MKNVLLSNINIKLRINNGITAYGLHRSLWGVVVFQKYIILAKSVKKPSHIHQASILFVEL